MTSRITITDPLGTTKEHLVQSVHTKHVDGCTLIVAFSPGEKPIAPSDVLHSLVQLGLLQPKGPEYAHLPLGIYAILLQNGAIPLAKGEKGGPGIFGYWICHDPELAKTDIDEALIGDAWEASEKYVAGTADDASVLVLFRRVQ